MLPARRRLLVEHRRNSTELRGDVAGRHQGLVPMDVRNGGTNEVQRHQVERLAAPLELVLPDRRWAQRAAGGGEGFETLLPFGYFGPPIPKTPTYYLSGTAGDHPPGAGGVRAPSSSVYVNVGKSLSNFWNPGG